MRFRRRNPKDAGQPALLPVDPANLLFSLPTIADALPATGDAPSPGTVAVHLHEDDWRQLELVSMSCREDVVANFEHIRQVLGTRQGHGFPNIHVRSEPGAPLRGLAVTPADLEQALRPSSTQTVGLTVGGYSVIGGRAYLGDSAAVYSVGDDGGLSVLGVHITGPVRPGDELLDCFASFARTLDALIVDWVQARSTPKLETLED